MQNRTDSDMYYWVGYPSFLVDEKDPSKGWKHTNVPYWHWICLRYLFNTYRSSNSHDGMSETRLGYHNIPRITMYLHKTLKVSAMKSLLYAHLASSFYAGYSLGYTDFYKQPTGYAIQKDTPASYNPGNNTYPDPKGVKRTYNQVFGDIFQLPCVKSYSSAV
jgi:hypothetical protein